MNILIDQKLCFELNTMKEQFIKMINNNRIIDIETIKDNDMEVIFIDTIYKKLPNNFKCQSTDNIYTLYLYCDGWYKVNYIFDITEITNKNNKTYSVLDIDDILIVKSDNIIPIEVI